jgi:hypothetical protein
MFIQIKYALGNSAELGALLLTSKDVFVKSYFIFRARERGGYVWEAALAAMLTLGLDYKPSTYRQIASAS